MKSGDKTNNVLFYIIDEKCGLNNFKWFNNANSNFKLPHIPLPKYNGNYHGW